MPSVMLVRVILIVFLLQIEILSAFLKSAILPRVLPLISFRISDIILYDLITYFMFKNIFYWITIFYLCPQSMYCDHCAFTMNIGVDVSHYLCSRIPPERDSRE